MSSAARSASSEPRAVGTPILSGPVAVCVDRPVLALDRPFTYELGEELEAGVGSLVQVPFHGRRVRGWVLGTAEEIPPRVLRVGRLVSPVRFFDEAALELYRWMSERYVAPLAAVIARSVPPRVASEEKGRGSALGSASPLRSVSRLAADTAAPSRPLLADGYTNADRLLGSLRRGAGTLLVRTAPGEEAAIAVECVGAALAAGRTAIVLVPEVDPVPATVAALLDAFGDAVACFFGGDRRSRYRTWLAIPAGRYRVVVGTRPTVFAPLPSLGLLYVAREHHTLHREERSPYYHVRDVALARARIQRAVCVMASAMPSLEARAAEHVDVEPVGRRLPPVEVVRPGAEGRSPRLVAALKGVRRAFLFQPLPGYGIARVCRACGEPAACAECGGVLRVQEGTVRCAVCGATGRCASCGAADFGILRGGAERVEEWARGVATVPVRRVGAGDRPGAPTGEGVLVGGVEAVKDLGVVRLDLVGILDADAASRRPGLAARERALATWYEVAGWADPRGRVIVQTRHPNDPAVQALVGERPDRFVRAELPRRADAGFPVGCPVLRVVGSPELEDELRALPHRTLLTSAVGDQAICLVALDPGDVSAFGRAARGLAERGVVTRVEAEPHL